MIKTLGSFGKPTKRAVQLKKMEYGGTVHAGLEQRGRENWCRTRRLQTVDL